MIDSYTDFIDREKGRQHSAVVPFYYHRKQNIKKLTDIRMSYTVRNIAAIMREMKL